MFEIFPLEKAAPCALENVAVFVTALKVHAIHFPRLAVSAAGSNRRPFSRGGILDSAFAAKQIA
jgi:hypothetical protein